MRTTLPLLGLFLTPLALGIALAAPHGENHGPKPKGPKPAGPEPYFREVLAP